MKNNWVEQHMAERGQRKNEEQIEFQKSRLASAGAPRYFRMLSDTVEGDVKLYHTAGGSRTLKYERNSDTEFTVREPVYPATTLTARLNETTIEYSYWHGRNDADHGGTRRHACLKVIANLEGSVQAAQGEIVFSSPSEASQALLKPVFDYGGH